MARSRSYEYKWESHRLNADEQNTIDVALLQNYRYLNAGTQCAAFISEDGKYILKFFKKKPLAPRTDKPSICVPFLTQWRKERKLKKYLIKRDTIFSAYRISCDRLSKQTGVLFVHFNTTGRLKKSIHLFDASNKAVSVYLDDWDLVLERRAEPLRNHLDRLIAQGDIKTAKDSVRKLLELQCVFFSKGMRNRDKEFVNNYGFIDDAPVLFDVGRLLPCEGQEGREKFGIKLNTFLTAFGQWIHTFYPVLIPDCDAAIAKIFSTLQDDHDEFSMTCFHPYELKWESHAMDADEKKVLELALCQPYDYLSKGGQSVVFASQDGKYVIKFFKQKIFALPQERSRFAFIAYFFKQRKLKQCAAKRDRIFSSYKIAYERLSKETGMLYIHFNTTSHLQKNLCLTLACGASIDIDLNDCDFIVERRAQRLPDHLNALLAQGNVKEAGVSLRRLLELHCVFLEKEVRTREGNIVNNYGFVDGAPILFGGGRLVACVGQKAKKKYQKRVQLLLPSFRNWVKTQYPMLIPYCDAAIGKILETTYQLRAKSYEKNRLL